MPQRTLSLKWYQDKDLTVVLGIHAGVKGNLDATMIYVYSQLCILQCMYALDLAVLYRRHRLLCAATVGLASQLTTAIFLVLCQVHQCTTATTACKAEATIHSIHNNKSEIL